MRYGVLAVLFFWFVFCGGASAKEPRALRVAVDAERGRVWALQPDGVHVHALHPKRKLAHVPLPGWIVAGEPDGCVPDLALDRWGDAVVTSDVVPVLWKVHAGSFSVSRHELALDADTDRDVGFAGLVRSPEHGVFFAVSFHHGTLWRIDPTLRRAEKVALSPLLHGACQLTLRPPRVRPLPSRLVELCAYTPAEWTVRLSPDLRSARASRGVCLD